MLAMTGCTASGFSMSALSVEGGHIVDDEGEPVVLRGVAIADPYFLGEVDRRSIDRDIRELADTWKATVVRVPISPDLWQHHPRYLERYVDPIVDVAGENGLYVVLAWQGHGNPITGETEQPNWRNNSPWNGKPFNPNWDLAIAALKRLADRYGDRPWVMLTVFSEPAFISWTEWLRVAHSLIDAVRSVDSDMLLFVPGIDFGYDLTGVFEEPVERSNVVYETHPYPNKGFGWMGVVDSIRSRYPVFVGEWGYGEEFATGGTPRATSYEEELTEFCERRGIGWTAWIFHDEWQPALLESFDDYRPSAFGEFVRNQLRGSERMAK